MMASQFNAEEIAAYFDEFGDREWERLVRTPVDEVSLHIHAHYLRRFIQPGMRVLEIGAGAGRFTQVLAGIGCTVLVGDISPRQIELNQYYAHKLDFAGAVEDWQVLDMCAMPTVEESGFDAVVAYGGPFSYALDRRDDALAECLRVLKARGVLLLSVMALWGTSHSALPGVLAVPVANNRKITATGDLVPATLPGRSQHMHLFRAWELRAWLVGAGLDVLAMSASGVLAAGWGDWLRENAREDADRWAELLRMELAASAEPGALDMGTHLVAVARRIENALTAE